MEIVKTVVACNVCYVQTNREVESDSVLTLVFRRSRSPRDQEFSIDLCETHAESFLSIVEYAEKFSSAVRRGPGRPRQQSLAALVIGDPDEVEPVEIARIPCATCGRPYKKGTGMSMHVKTKHPEVWEKRETSK